MVVLLSALLWSRWKGMDDSYLCSICSKSDCALSPEEHEINWLMQERDGWKFAAIAFAVALCLMAVAQVFL